MPYLPLTAVLTAIAMLATILWAPTESTMGDSQRIVYIHVAVAWCGLAGFLVTAGAGLLYLVRRDLAWDHWAQAAAELGWLGATLTLVTGSIWAHAAWNTWWSWDPRLATMFVLWAINSANLVVRGAIEDPHRRARTGAVLAIVGAVDLPLVVMATRWFRGIHPRAPQMDLSMRGVLLVSAMGLAALFAVLLARRRAQLGLERMVAALESRSDP